MKVDRKKWGRGLLLALWAKAVAEVGILTKIFKLREPRQRRRKSRMRIANKKQSPTELFNAVEKI